MCFKFFSCKGGFKGAYMFSHVHITFSEASLAHWVSVIVVFGCFVFCYWYGRLCKRL